MRSKWPLLGVALLASACESMPSWLGGTPPEKPKLAGERLVALPVAEDLASDTALQSQPMNLPSVTANAEWAQHTGVVSANSSNLAWAGSGKSASATIGEGDDFTESLVPRPVVAAGKVFAMDAKGHISAHEASDISRRIWQIDGVKEEDEPDLVGGGLAYHDGKVFAVSGYGAVAAFDAATGQQLWRGSVGFPFRSAPRIEDGTLYAITIDNQIYAFDAATGAVRWNQRGINETTGLMNNVSPTVEGGVVIVPYSSGDIYALAVTNGNEIWRESLISNQPSQGTGLFAAIGGDPVIDGQVVFAVSSSGNLSVFSMSSGQHVWSKPIASTNTPWVTGDYLYVLTSDDTLVCLLKYSGAVRWATKLVSYEDEEKRLDRIRWNGPVMVDGKLALVGSHGILQLFDAKTGGQLQSIEVADGIVTAPIVAAGRMYLVDKNATLYSLE